MTSMKNNLNLEGGIAKRNGSISRFESTQGGQVIIGSLLLFLTISIIVLVGIATPVAIQVRSAADFLQSKQGYISADVLNEESLYRLNKGWTLPSQLVLSINESTSTALITDVNGEKQVIATGISGLFTRISKSVFTPQSQKSIFINYALQVGNGGLTMSGSPTVTGNAFVNGNISGSGVSTITGNAYAAATTPENTDQSNGAGTPAVNLSFGTANASQDFAQGFTVSTSTSLSRVLLYMKKSGTPANATVRIIEKTSTNNDVSGNVKATATLNSTQVTTSYAWVPVVFASNTSLNPGTTYWIAVDVPSNSPTNYYVIGVSNTNSYGAANSVLLGRYGVNNSWTVSGTNYDAFFQVFLGGVSSISGVVVQGDASAYSVSNTTVSGSLYCQSGTGNNKSCNTSSSTPNAITYPFSDANINDWKADAAAGGTRNGDWTISGGSDSSTTTGSIKINGNLSISGSAKLTIKGTLYVTGDITVSGAGILALDSSYGSKSGVIVADGKVNVSSSPQSGSAIQGSGTTGSYPILVTTSGCGGTTSCSGANAMTISGAAQAVVILVPNGKADLSGSTSVNGVVAYSLNLSGGNPKGGTRIQYDPGIANVLTTSVSSSATSWVTDTWKEIFQ